jgi:hypothetical protein
VIRAPHQDEPRIGQCRWGGWVIRAFAPRLTATPMLPFERKASPFCAGGAIIVNGRMSCVEWLVSRRNSSTTSAHRSALRWIKHSYRSLAGAPSVLLSTFLICSGGGYSDRRCEPHCGHHPLSEMFLERGVIRKRGGELSCVTLLTDALFMLVYNSIYTRTRCLHRQMYMNPQNSLY